MIDDQGDKLIRLAKDIIESGINPSDLPIVIPHESEKNNYIVVEGNRRVTTLKLLFEPQLCTHPIMSSKFKDLSNIFLKNPIAGIDCVIYKDRESSDHWVDLKHTGANNGVGTEQWDATARRRRIDRNKENPGTDLQIKNFLIEVGGYDPSTLDAFRGIPITTVKRLVGTKEIREFLGLELKEGVLYSKHNKEETLRVLEEFFAPFASGDKKVKHVYDKDDRISYLSGLDPATGANPLQATSDAWPLTSPPPSETKQPPPGKQPPLGKGFPQARSKPLSQNRKILIDKPISISHRRINGIYGELRKLEVKDFPNAVAVLLRVFLEASLDNFIEINKIESHSNDKLHQKITKVAKHMEDNGLLSNHELKPLRNAASVPNSLFSTNTLNAYVHNSIIQPKPTELNATWNEMEPFMKKLWE
jgi:hypothetical protein